MFLLFLLTLLGSHVGISLRRRLRLNPQPTSAFLQSRRYFRPPDTRSPAVFFGSRLRSAAARLLALYRAPQFPAPHQGAPRSSSSSSTLNGRLALLVLLQSHIMQAQRGHLDRAAGDIETGVSRPRSLCSPATQADLWHPLSSKIADVLQPRRVHNAAPQQAPPQWLVTWETRRPPLLTECTFSSLLF